MRSMVGLLLAATAISVQAQPPGEQELLQAYAYQLAVAETSGDVSSDQRLAKGLEWILAAQGAPQAGDPPASEAMRQLLARVQVVAAELQGNVDAARESDPFLLGADLGCWPRREDRALCDARRARLEAIAGDNAYHALVLMVNAWMVDDADGFLRAARSGAAAPDYDSWPAVGFKSLLARYRQVPAPPMDGMGPLAEQHGPEVMAMSIAMATTLPAYQKFSQPCRESEGELRAHCLAIAGKMMVQGSNLIEVRIGASVVEALGSPEDVRQATARLREIDWLMTQGLPLLTASDSVPVAGMDEYLVAFAEQGEIAAMQALLTQHRIALLPPGDWTRPGAKAAGTP